MKYSKNADIILLLPLLLFFTTGQREKKYCKKTLLVSAGDQKRWKASGSGSNLPQYQSNPKSKFPTKFILHKMISLKVRLF